MNAELAHKLVEDQFPKWKDLSIVPIHRGGWDHHSFHLGKEMVLRFPRNASYAPQGEKEFYWLPILAPHLPFPIPEPIELGKPSELYPFSFSIYRWIEGVDASHAQLSDLCPLAEELAQFLVALQHIPATDGPSPGVENFFRGAAIEKYDSEAREAIRLLQGQIDQRRALSIWEAALKTKWNRKPVWVHGDVSPGNLLIEGERLRAVIDFGLLAAGDPACDLAIAWTFFDSQSREIFLKNLSLDADTVSRSKGWALWKAAITASGLSRTNAFSTQRALSTIRILDRAR